MVMYDNELKTKENKNCTKDKIEPQQIFAEPHSGEVNIYHSSPTLRYIPSQQIASTS